MKKILLGVLLAAGWLSGNELHWENDLKSAFAKAEKEHRPLMVMVESESCRWCKKMKFRTLADEHIVKRLKRFVTVKTMKGSEEAVHALPSVEYVPTIFFMRPDRNIVEKVTGYYAADDFGSLIESAEKKLGQK